MDQVLEQMQYLQVVNKRRDTTNNIRKYFKTKELCTYFNIVDPVKCLFSLSSSV